MAPGWRGGQITLAQDRDPWDQQPRESDRKYTTFLAYRDIGRMRTLTAANHLLTNLGYEFTYNYIKWQSHIFRWTERAQAWDRHQDQANIERLMAERRDMIERHRRIANRLIATALDSIRALEEEGSEPLPPADIVRFVKLATDIEVRALGEPSQTVAVTGPAGGPIVVDDIAGLTDEERRVRLREITDELARRAGLRTVDDEEE